MQTPPPETPEQLQARQADERRQIGDMTMHLIRLAYGRAVEQLEAPPPETASEKPAKPAYDYVQAYNRLVQTMRTLHALEARLAAPKPTPKRATVYRPLNPTDPRRTILRHALHFAARNQPGLAALRRALDDALSKALDADPEEKTPPIEILDAIATEFDLPIDTAKLHDDVLFGPGKGPRPAPGSITVPDDD